MFQSSRSQRCYLEENSYLPLNEASFRECNARRRGAVGNLCEQPDNHFLWDHAICTWTCLIQHLQRCIAGGNKSNQNLTLWSTYETKKTMTWLMMNILCGRL